MRLTHRAFLALICIAALSAPAMAKGHRGHHHKRPTHMRVMKPAQAAFSFAPFSVSALVEEARRYLGTNPTGWSHNWCAHFLDMILRKTGHPGGGNSALAYAHYGHRVPGPRVGAIAVMRRRGGGHVGVVAGTDARGNPILISGNYRHKVSKAVFPRGRIFAYVMPN